MASIKQIPFFIAVTVAVLLTACAQLSTPHAAPLPGHPTLGSGVAHSCLLTQKGEVFCWGQGAHSNQDTSPDTFDKSFQVKGLDAADLASGWYHTCVTTRDGHVKCWGDNYFDQLGDGAFLSSVDPKEVSRAGSDVVSLGGGHYTACALASDGKVSCWGDTSFGQIGDGTARWK